MPKLDSLDEKALCRHAFATSYYSRKRVKEIIEDAIVDCFKATDIYPHGILYRNFTRTADEIGCPQELREKLCSVSFVENVGDVLLPFFLSEMIDLQEKFMEGLSLEDLESCNSLYYRAESRSDREMTVKEQDMEKYVDLCLTAGETVLYNLFMYCVLSLMCRKMGMRMDLIRLIPILNGLDLDIEQDGIALHASVLERSKPIFTDGRVFLACAHSSLW